MSYLITLTDGTTLATIANYSVDTTHTSIDLPGHGFPNWGQYFINGLVNHLENFSNTSAPSNPLQGQLWWDSEHQILKVYNSSAWVATNYQKYFSAPSPLLTISSYASLPPGTFGFASDCRNPGEATAEGTGSMVFVNNNSIVCAVWSGIAATN